MGLLRRVRYLVQPILVSGFRVVRSLARAARLPAVVDFVAEFFPSSRMGYELTPFAPWIPFMGKKIGASATGNKVVMLTISNLRIDPRIEREARALAGAGFSVTVVAPDPRSCDSEPYGVNWGNGIDFCWVEAASNSYATRWPGFYSRRLYNAAVLDRPFAIHSHDLFTAFVGLSAARKTGAHLVCDFHEWGSENVKWDTKTNSWIPYSKNWKRSWKWLERKCFALASEVITVSDSIADAMAREVGGGRRPKVIRNVPPLDLKPTKDYPPLKEQIGLPEEQFVVLWQGGTGPTRLIEPVIEALEFVPECTFVIRGPTLDLFGPAYLELAERIGVSEQLVLLDAVPSRDVVAAARGADAGVWTLPDFCPNFRLALPNKVFEYMASGLPLLVADYPEVRKIIDGYQVGVCFDPYNAKSIAEAISTLARNPALRFGMKSRIPEALESLDAEDEWGKLVALYCGLSGR